MRDIKTHSLYIFIPFFTAAYIIERRPNRAVIITDNLCTKQGNCSIFCAQNLRRFYNPEQFQIKSWL